MIYYDTPYGKVELNTNTKNIIVRLSGGFDSALMTLLLAMNVNDDVTIHPITVVRGPIEGDKELERVDITPVAKNIVQFIRENCGKDQIDLRDPLFATAYKWNTTNSYVEAQKFLINSVTGSINDDDKSIYKSIIYNGVTMNPPEQIAPDWFHKGREKKRDHNTYVDNGDTYGEKGLATVYRGLSNRTIHIEPFANADKRVTMWLADHVGLIHELLSVTRSCEGDREHTDNWTRECITHCWWCYERHWALQNYKDNDG